MSEKKRCRHKGRGCIFRRDPYGGWWHWCANCGALQRLKEEKNGSNKLVPDGKPHTIIPGCSEKRYSEFWR